MFYVYAYLSIGLGFCVGAYLTTISSERWALVSLYPVFLLFWLPLTIIFVINFLFNKIKGE